MWFAAVYVVSMGSSQPVESSQLSSHLEDQHEDGEGHQPGEEAPAASKQYNSLNQTVLCHETRALYRMLCSYVLLAAR
jgi:hypothetical protein